MAVNVLREPALAKALSVYLVGPKQVVYFLTVRQDTDSATEEQQIRRTFALQEVSFSHVNECTDYIFLRSYAMKYC